MRIVESQQSEARSLLKQAKSYSYPQVDMSINYTHLGEQPYFLLSETTVNADIDLTGVNPFPGIMPDHLRVPITIPETRSDVAGQDVFKLKVELKQPLFTGGKIKQPMRQAGFMVSIADRQRDRSAQEIVFQVKSLYFQLAFANRALHVVRDTEKRLEVVAKFLDNLYKHYVPKEGERGVTKSDYLRSKFVLAKVMRHESEIQRLKEEARKSLRLACGLIDSDFSVSGEVERFAPKLPSSDTEELKKLAVEGRPEIRQLELTQEISRSEIKRAKAGYFPDIGVFGYYTRMVNDFPANDNIWAVGVAASIPIFNGMRTSAEVKRAKVASIRTASQQDLMELKVRHEIDDLYAMFDDSKRKMKIYSDALAQTRERRQLESESYLLEASKYEDYLDALEDEVNTHVLLLKTKATYYITLAALELAVGM